MGLHCVVEAAVTAASGSDVKAAMMVARHQALGRGATAVRRHCRVVAQQLDGCAVNVMLGHSHPQQLTRVRANPVRSAGLKSTLAGWLQQGDGKTEKTTAKKKKKEPCHNNAGRQEICRCFDTPASGHAVGVAAFYRTSVTTASCHSSTVRLRLRSRSVNRNTNNKRAWHRSLSPMVSREGGRSREDRCAVRAASSGTRPANVVRDPIKVIINGASTDLGLEAVRAISHARGMEIVGAIDSKNTGCDVGELAGLDEPLEIPIIQDLVMVLGSATQQARSDASVVLVDLAIAAKMYENVRQATAFGVRSVVGIPGVDMGKVAALSEFCEKASMGCIIAPDLSIGAAVLRQLTATAAFHYGSVDVIETRGDGWGEAEKREDEADGSSGLPGWEAMELAQSMSGLGRIFNKGDMSTESPARGVLVGDGVRVHSLRVPGAPVRRHEVRFGSSGELLTLTHDVLDAKAYMPGLLLAVRRVVRLRSLVYGLEKIL
ncbi:hypothetical protein CBR_g30244 [Chara braunii]|uniref:Dihydrodipicolinate reductase C-terminal domain-containing protein n=1 Tax=Chara braunii TaxID=69332 RepID=A0A388LCQ7_CHABU|nr:hypothetical protein CBR_g30244 [Chara braunii]|eukprot:GBG79983.1 hypothetical protein CBR_g30244 [Chara braunii]